VGKTPMAVSKILGLPSRQLAEKEMKRVLQIARFYLDHLEAMRRIPDLTLSLDRMLLLDLFVLKRKNYVAVAQVLGVTKQELIRRFRFLLDHLRSSGYSDIADLLSGTWSNRRLRISMKGAVGNRLEWKGKRRAMVADAWRYDLRNMLLGMIGKVDYEWGSQRFSWPSGVGVADCSGLVIECLKKVGKLPANFRDTTAQGLLNYFAPVKTPKLCDLVFYGRETSSVTHVMFYLGKDQLREGDVTDGLRHRECVIGMCDGAKDMQACDARVLGAGLYVRTSPRYRKDFLAYGGVK